MLHRRNWLWPEDNEECVSGKGNNIGPHGPAGFPIQTHTFMMFWSMQIMLVLVPLVISWHHFIFLFLRVRGKIIILLCFVVWLRRLSDYLVLISLISLCYWIISLQQLAPWASARVPFSAA